MSLAGQVLGAARDRQVMVATAESCTGGLIAAALTDIPGSSASVDCGFITYSNSAKQRMLHVKRDTLETFGAVSEEVATEMALGALANSDADFSVSVTGIAGPGGSEFKPEGCVCFGLATPRGVSAQTMNFGAIGRNQVRAATVAHALTLLLKALKDN